MSPVGNFDLDVFYRAIAPHYDLIYENLNAGEDVAFYRDLAAASPGPVMEMGCGTGRVLLPLARAGFSISGMDCSLAMLQQLCGRLQSEEPAVRERVILVHGDIRSCDAGCRFPLIIAAGNVLHSFLERRDQRAWFRNVRRHLTPGGAFCFDVFQFDYQRLSLAPEEWRLDMERADPRCGQSIRAYSRCRHEPEAQQFRVEIRCDVTSASGETVVTQLPPLMQRWFTRGEVECLLEMEGFRVADYWGSFRKEAFGRGARLQVVRAIAEEQ